MKPRDPARAVEALDRIRPLLVAAAANAGTPEERAVLDAARLLVEGLDPRLDVSESVGIERCTVRVAHLVGLRDAVRALGGEKERDDENTR